jgi:hypothetical protein
LKRIIEREQPCNPSATPFKLFGLGNWPLTPALVAMRNPVPWLSRHRRIFSLGAFFVWQTSGISTIGAAASLPVEKYPSLFSAQACSSPEKNASQAQVQAELPAAAAAAARNLPSGLDPRVKVKGFERKRPARRLLPAHLRASALCIRCRGRAAAAARCARSARTRPRCWSMCRLRGRACPREGGGDPARAREVLLRSCETIARTPAPSYPSARRRAGRSCALGSVAAYAATAPVF